MVLSGLAILIVAVFSLSGCIKVETGQSAEEAAVSSEQRARGMRSDWAERLMDASPLKVGRMLKAHLDSTSAQYIKYGFTVVNRWEEGNEGRGTEIPAAEMSEIVSQWNQSMEPVLKANEDMAEYAWESLERTEYFGEPGMEKFRVLISHFYDIRSDVFYPSGSVDDYQERLYQDQDKLGDLGREVDRLLVQFGG